MANMQIKDVQYLLHKIGGHEVHFELSDEDRSTDPSYYGYLAENGAWIILEWNSVAGTYRYKTGKELYAVSWAVHGGLSYSYYSQLV